MALDGFNVPVNPIHWHTDPRHDEFNEIQIEAAMTNWANENRLMGWTEGAPNNSVNGQPMMLGEFHNVVESGVLEHFRGRMAIPNANGARTGRRHGKVTAGWQVHDGEES